MFGLGAWEIALILAAALVFLGPQKLPEVARTLGKSLREIRRTANDFTRELNYESYLRDEPTKRPPRDTGPEEDPYRKIAEAEAEAGDDHENDHDLDGAESEPEVGPEPLPEIRPATDSIAYEAPAPEPEAAPDYPSESEKG